MTDLVLHLLVFGGVAAAALLGPLMLGRLLRPSLPTTQKHDIYECGETTIGSSYVQFDLRFYVVGLLFIIFDVELVFFFPWLLAFGGAVQLADTRLVESERVQLSGRLLDVAPGSPLEQVSISSSSALTLSWTAMVDVLIFFTVLMVGFAYLWKRGDLEWVRSVSNRRPQVIPQDLPLPASPLLDR